MSPTAGARQSADIASYRQFFRTATGEAPFPFQERMALDGDLPALLRAPTGAGKTAAAVLAWLWRRRFATPEVRAATPRRIAYCLPMRTLVEQTQREAEAWMAKLTAAYPDPMRDPPKVHLLLGGEASRDWRIEPEKDAILVGTQDMLLSRALNRGYGMSRYQWPVEFGLLNADCLWVLDEVQLMGVGLSTSCQLDAFRRRFGTFGAAPSLWMSATLEPSWMATVDYQPPPVAELSAAELKGGSLAPRMNASKVLRKGKVALTKDSVGDAKEYATKVAAAIAVSHQPGSLTLVVLNTVERAVAVHRALGSAVVDPRADLRLVHSRFRPHEREMWAEFLGPSPQVPDAGRIIVATQVVEAGVDLSAKTMFTELAPWPSIVQRLGRCNRKGEPGSSDVTWFDVGDEVAAPYSPEQLDEARGHLKKFEGKSASPAVLATIPVGPAKPPAHLLRAKDLVELFDTSPDLAGADVDIGRYIREGEDLDVLVAWRAFEGQPQDTMPALRREELCPVPIGKLRDFLKARKAGGVYGWRWDPLDKAWARVSDLNSLRPGQRILLPSKAGGYDAQRGWDPKSSDPVPPLPEEGPPPDSDEADHQSCTAELAAHTRPYWQPLSGHALRTEEKLTVALDALPALGIPGEVRQAMLAAARGHDIGKAHQVFQNALLGSVPPKESEGRAATLWAKSPGSRLRFGRTGFRHELASALAMLHRPFRDGLPPWAWDLACYLVAAHHGKVRVSLRSFPHEEIQEDGKVARGVRHGDPLPAVDLGGGVVLPATTLNLGCTELGLDDEGRASWQERVLALRDRPDLGPFRLAYLEALVRAADVAASRDPGTEDVHYA